MKAIILAAGIGSRLKYKTWFKPKCMVKVFNKSIIENQIESLLENGINDIYVIGGYKFSILKKFLDKKYKHINLLNNEEYRNTNNMFSLYIMKKYINDDFIILNGDVFMDKNIIRDVVRSNKKDLIVCDRSVEYNKESMKVVCNETNNIISISKEIDELNFYAISIDVYKFSLNTLKELFNIIENKYINKDDLNKWSEIAINDLLNNIKILPLETTYKWVEIDNLLDYNHALDLFKEKNDKN